MTDANNSGNNAGVNSDRQSGYQGNHQSDRKRAGQAGSRADGSAPSRRLRSRAHSSSEPAGEKRRARRESVRARSRRTSTLKGSDRGGRPNTSNGNSSNSNASAYKKGPTRSAISQGIQSTVSQPDTAKGKLVPLKKRDKPKPIKSAQHKDGQTKARPIKSRRRTRRKLPVPLLYCIRLGIIGLGVAALGGTLLKALPEGEAQTVQSEPAVQEVSASATFPIELGQEIAPLKAEMQELPNLYPDLTPKAFYINVETGDYVNLEGTDAIAAASTVKLPILLAFFEEVDGGRLTFDRTIEMLPKHIAEGSGDMQLAVPGTRFTALEVATQMIVTSDNTATNMMIDLLGGPTALNERFVSYGLEKTVLNAPLPDVEGTNKTSAKDLVRTMLLISSDRLSMRSRDRILNILNRTQNKALLADGMAQKEALTYNKTGYIGKMLGDVALVDLSNGQRYIVAALVERPMNDNRATELIHRISDMTFEISDQAVQTAVTPLGNPDGEPSADLDTPEAEISEEVEMETAPTEASDSGVEITPVEEP